MEHLDFWEKHEVLLKKAWAEWYDFDWPASEGLPALDEAKAIHPEVFEQVRGLWGEPTEERELGLKEALWEEPIPGVWVCRNFLTKAGIRALRGHLGAASGAGIPTRRPNGMNKHGLVLDKETQGGVSYPSLNAFLRVLVDTYVRPLGRMFFPEYVGRNTRDDASSYAFTIHYANHSLDTEQTSQCVSNATDATERSAPVAARSPKGDLQLPEHSDASVFTMNINLNLPGDNDNKPEDFQGSILEFVVEGSTAPLRMEPGMAVLHRGLHRHRALPIEQGERHQLIVWLFGTNGYVRFAPYENPQDRMSVEERWSPPPPEAIVGDAGYGFTTS